MLVDCYLEVEILLLHSTLDETKIQIILVELTKVNELKDSIHKCRSVLNLNTISTKLLTYLVRFATLAGTNQVVLFEHSVQL